jgi:hypothetical protein
LLLRNPAERLVYVRGELMRRALAIVLALIAIQTLAACATAAGAVAVIDIVD